MTEPARDSRTAAASDHRWLVLVIVAIAQLMVVLDATIVNIALPSAQHALGFARQSARDSNSPARFLATASSSSQPGGSRIRRSNPLALTDFNSHSNV